MSSSRPQRRDKNDKEQEGKEEEEEVVPLVPSTTNKKTRNQRTTTTSTTTTPGLDGYCVIPLKQRSTLFRLDVFPFLILYLLLIVLDNHHHHHHDEDDDSASWTVFSSKTQEKIFGMVAFPLAFFCHLTLVLWQQWKVSVRCFVGYQKQQQQPPRQSTRNNNSVKKDWTHCLVSTPVVGGNHDSGIVPVTHQNSSGNTATASESVVVAIVKFHDVVFRATTTGGTDPLMDSLWTTTATNTNETTNGNNNNNDDDDGASSSLFHRLRYPSDLPISFYTKWGGHKTLPSIRQAHHVYGDNTTHIRLPPFLDLLGQQLLAPFFLFQLFCVLLWSLDEYWYYALFTLLALLMFESTVAYNRRKGLERLRGTLRHPYYVLAYRHASWIRIRTDEIVPGDLVSLVARTPPIHVPADMVLLNGTAVVDEALLTGESVPQLKNPIVDNDHKDDDKSSTTTTRLDMEDPAHKQSILFGGTMLVSQNNSASSSSSVPSPPDHGILCFTLRTGFETAQGSLLRSMAHSSMKSADGIHTRDTFVFVLMLLVCAVVSAVSVLREGWNDETRNRFRLVLHVIIIVTSVVPPELPMELSLAVTNSVAELMQRCNVYCTEPFRIPWAGQVNVCCFDKTGTLTSDEMQLRGVRLFSTTGLDDHIDKPLDDDNDNNDDYNDSLCMPDASTPWDPLRVMAGCHSLAVNRMANGFRAVIGDPLEKVVLGATGFTLRSNNFLVAPDDEEMDGRARVLMIHHRFAFSSKLKRMTVLLTENTDTTVWAVSKGAPETIKTFLRPDSIPANYDKVYLHHMGMGQRVLAMAYRSFPKTMNHDQVKDTGRTQVEKDLLFAGFLVLDCPIKADSHSVIKELKKSGHDTVMVTGDAVLTAAEVSKQVGILKRWPPTYELRPTGTPRALSDFGFVPLKASIDEPRASDTIPLSRSNLSNLQDMAQRSEASFCISGAVLVQVARAALQEAVDEGTLGVAVQAMDENNVLFHPVAQTALSRLVPLVSVFARHAPRQKEAVVAAFNCGGKHTLMCGDGTNDVGALKRAHVGISIISAPELESKHRQASEGIAKAQKAERKKKKKNDGKKKKSKKKKRGGTSLEDSLRMLKETQDQLDRVELGDASVASPFTSRAMSIKCCKDVLQQGRCTLVTMLQIYKILGINCLVNALVLTKLHMHGVKQSDRQLTIMGMAIAVLFFFVTRGKPLPTLSSQRPPSSVLCRQALLSIASQFAVHFVAIVVATETSMVFVDPYDPSIIPDASFNPNVLNSCTFLLTMLAIVNTFAINYRGRPYMQDLRQNKLLYRSVQLCYAVLLICVLQIFMPLNDLLQLTPFPDTNLTNDDDNDDDWLASIASPEAGRLTGLVRDIGFPLSMCALMVMDTVAAFCCEKIIVRVFEG